ncbi:MAG: cation diffusion facilitator family transporter [Hyphomicrobiaceae bacterium]
MWNAQNNQLWQVALASIGVALTVMALKAVAAWLTGSAALFSDALESVVNVVTATVAFVAIGLAGQPADRRHQYGHHKAEYLSAVLVGVLVVVAALLVFRDAYDALMNPRTITEPVLGLTLSAIAGLINSAWAYVLVTRGRAWRSPALEADGWHLVSDIVTSAGTLTGVALAVITGFQLLDPLLAALVGVSILWAGWSLFTRSIGGLMDEAVPADVSREIRCVIAEAGGGAIQAHDIRTRVAGQVTFIELHLVVPGAMTVATSHRICDRIEVALETAIPGAQVVIHVEPETEAKTTGVPID